MRTPELVISTEPTPGEVQYLEDRLYEFNSAATRNPQRWNLKFQVGPNQASFTAGHQAFAAEVPQTPTFSLAQGTLYLFEVWDGKGRLKSERFRL